MINGPALMHEFYLGKLENQRGLFTNPAHKSMKSLTLKGGVSFNQPKKQSPPPERLCCNLAKLSFRASLTPYQACPCENTGTGQAPSKPAPLKTGARGRLGGETRNPGPRQKI